MMGILVFWTFSYAAVVIKLWEVNGDGKATRTSSIEKLSFSQP